MQHAQKSDSKKGLIILVWGQLSDAICQKIAASENFSNIASSGCAIELLKGIKGIAYRLMYAMTLIKAI
jgi:hypothetical protein